MYHTLLPNVGAVPKYNRKTYWSTKLYEHVGNAYNKEAQEQRFSNLQLPCISKADCMFFVHFHLAPVVDFDSKQGRDSTFHVENCIPGFQKVNQANWKTIEDRVRKSIEHKVEIITGQFGQLSLKTLSDETVKLTLESDRDPLLGNRKNLPRYDRIKVPEFFYKIVRDTVTTEAYVIITSNNPLMTELDASKRMCNNDICATSLLLKDFSKGYTYCCAFQEFAGNMTTVFRTEFSGIIDVGNTKDAKSVPI